MTVPDSWQGAYKELVDFVARNPSIEIGENVISIPGDVRPEFYRLFDKVRTTFVKERFPGLLDEARLLSDSYVKAEEEVVGLLELSGVSMLADLQRFLHDPKDELMRELFDPLFDLLKGRIGIETFEEVQSKNIEYSFRKLYRSGYEKWVELSLVKLLESDRAFHIALPRPTLREMRTLVGRKLVPLPRESKSLSLKHEMTPVFIVPDFIVHSAKIDRYVAVRSELGKAMCAASEVSGRREWYSFESIREKYGSVELKPDLAIYVDDRPEDISLVADSERICRPDMIVECMEQKGWHEKEGLERVRLHHDVLNLGTFIVSKESVPEQVLEGLGEDIRLITAGFDQSELGPIIDNLTEKERRAREGK